MAWIALSSSLEYDQVPPIMSQQQELEEGSLNTRRASSSDDNGQSRFLFVLEHNQPETRTHAMRAHWQERRERRKETTARLIHPKPETSISSTPTPKRVQVSTSYKDSASTTTQESGQILDASRLSPGVPAQFLTGINYALSSSRLDPFDSFPVTLTAEHQKLIRLSTHATMMFGKTPASELNPMRDVWFPLDLSNAASFNAIMAHSAAHLAYFYGGTAPTRGTNSLQALKYKSNAIVILRTWMDDPDKALSNDAFAGTVRLLTFERYWGTEAEWRIHRDGLQRMIEARGGLHKLHSDWRLELVVGLVSLMSQPSWFSPSNNISGITYPEFLKNTELGVDFDIKHIRSIWLISFIQDMRNLMSISSHLYGNGLTKFPALHDAVLLTLSNFKTDVNFSSSLVDNARLELLFSISIMVQESIALSYTHPTHSPSTTNDNILESLDISLLAAPEASRSSVYALLSFLRTYFLDFGLPGVKKIEYVMQLTKIVTHLSLEAHLGIEKCLLNMFCRMKNGMMSFYSDNGATPDSLLSFVRGH